MRVKLSDAIRRWGEELLQDACHSLAKEMTLDPSAPGGMVTYRRTLTLSLFYKFYLMVLQKLGDQVWFSLPSKNLVLTLYDTTSCVDLLRV